jgi:hypothetical protein
LGEKIHKFNVDFRSKEIFQKKIRKRDNPKNLFPYKKVFGFNFVLVHFCQNISADMKLAYSSGFFYPY